MRSYSDGGLSAEVCRMKASAVQTGLIKNEPMAGQNQKQNQSLQFPLLRKMEILLSDWEGDVADYIDHHFDFHFCRYQLCKIVYREMRNSKRSCSKYLTVEGNSGDAVFIKIKDTTYLLKLHLLQLRCSIAENSTNSRV